MRSNEMEFIARSTNVFEEFNRDYYKYDPSKEFIWDLITMVTNTNLVPFSSSNKILKSEDFDKMEYVLGEQLDNTEKLKGLNPNLLAYSHYFVKENKASISLRYKNLLSDKYSDFSPYDSNTWSVSEHNNDLIKFYVALKYFSKIKPIQIYSFENKMENYIKDGKFPFVYSKLNIYKTTVLDAIRAIKKMYKRLFTNPVYSLGYFVSDSKNLIFHCLNQSMMDISINYHGESKKWKEIIDEIEKRS